jgi:protein phosphatase
MKFQWVTRTDVGRVRDHNEDSVWPPDDGASGDAVIVGVADGMGGHAGGEIASATALDSAMTVGGDPIMRIRAANLAVVDAAKQRPRLAGMGTTLTLAILDPSGSASLGHVGDSRAYLLRDGTLEQVTNDHSYVAQLIAQGTLTAEEAEHHPYRSVLTRAVGLDPAVDVDTHHINLRAGDRFLLCSDGLTSMVADAEIAAVVGSDQPIDGIADALIRLANEAGGVDNITVIVVDVTG